MKFNSLEKNFCPTADNTHPTPKGHLPEEMPSGVIYTEAATSSLESFSSLKSLVSFSSLNSPVSPESPVSPSSQELSTQKQRTIALNRCDLLIKYQEYYSAESGNILARKKDFLNSYNAGLLFPNIYQQLGTVAFGTIERWLKQYRENGNDYLALAPGYRYKSISTHKLTPEEEALFMDLLLRPNQFNIGAAIRIVKDTLRIKGMPSPSSPGTFRRYVDSFKKQNLDVWVLRRQGEKALRDKIEPYIQRDPSLLRVGDVLVADGKTTTFDVINPWTGRPQKATWVFHVDWKSNYIAGYELMLNENTQVVASSLRRAILTLGRTPLISYTDNGKAFKNKFFPKSNLEVDGHFNSLFSKLKITPVFAMPYNSKAKHVERIWRELVEIFERGLPTFTGTSPLSKPAYTMRNEKLHKEEHGQHALTIEQAIEVFQNFLNFYHNQPCPHVAGMSIKEVFEAEKAPATINESALDDLMMVNTDRTYKVGRNGVDLFNAQYWNEALYNYQRQRVQIRYSFFDLSYIKVYDEQGRYICAASRKAEIHPMAAYLGTPKDVNELKQQMKQTRELEKDTKRKAEIIKKQHQQVASTLQTGTYAGIRINKMTINTSEQRKEKAEKVSKLINPYTG